MGNKQEYSLRRVGRPINHPSNEDKNYKDTKYQMKLSKAELDYLESQTKM